MKKEKTLGVRMDPQMRRELEVISKVLHVPESTWVREKLTHDIQETIEDLKYQIVLEYMKRTISREELDRVFGDLAEDVDFVIEKTKEDFIKAKELAKKLE